MIKDKLKKLNVRPQKSKGQNFLYDLDAIRSIVNFGEPTADDKIVEIGPGLGALTTELLSVVDAVTVIEIEEEFCNELSAKFGERIKIINQDVVQVDIPGENILLYGNLPYSRSSDIIQWVIKLRNVKRAVFLLQKEFSERIAASPGTKAYGSLTVAVSLWCKATLGPIIGGDKFHPRANVNSQVLRLDFYKEPKVSVTPNFERVVRGAFNQRRKKLFNSLLSSGFLREEIEQALRFSEIDGGRRAETLSTEEFSDLARGFEGSGRKA